jgi:hypothetical protein
MCPCPTEPVAALRCIALRRFCVASLDKLGRRDECVMLFAIPLLLLILFPPLAAV